MPAQEFNPTIAMVDQLLRQMTYEAISTITQCLVVSVFVGIWWLAWRATRR